jgi:hypothetical protein
MNVRVPCRAPDPAAAARAPPLRLLGEAATDDAAAARARVRQAVDDERDRRGRREREERACAGPESRRLPHPCCWFLLAVRVAWPSRLCPWLPWLMYTESAWGLVLNFGREHVTCGLWTCCCLLLGGWIGAGIRAGISGLDRGSSKHITTSGLFLFFSPSGWSARMSSSVQAPRLELDHRRSSST